MIKKDRGIGAFIALWILVILINVAWVGTFIWAVIYVATHIGSWIHG